MENFQTEESRKDLKHTEEFWTEKLLSLTWFEKWEKLHNYEPGKHNNEWFIGGKVNLSYELLDKKVKEGHGNDVAIIAESPFTKTVTRHTIQEILDRTSRMAGVLNECGVRDGDRVSIYMPKIIETMIAMLAVVRLGAVYSMLTTIRPETAMAVRFDDFKAFFAGKPIPGITVKVLRPDGTEAEVNEIGRVTVKLPIPTVSSGFHEDKNGQKFTRDYLSKFPGHFDTKDEGLFNREGNLQVLNRSDSVFKIEGHRISCDALEHVLMSHSDVVECVVVTRIKSDFSELPVGLFVTNKSANRSGRGIAEELQALVGSQIGNWVTFDEIIQVEAIPKTEIGKIARETVKQKIRNS